MAATRPRSISAARSGSITYPAHPIACRSPAWPQPRRNWPASPELRPHEPAARLSLHSLRLRSRGGERTDRAVTIGAAGQPDTGPGIAIAVVADPDQPRTGIAALCPACHFTERSFDLTAQPAADAVLPERSDRPAARARATGRQPRLTAIPRHTAAN